MLIFYTYAYVYTVLTLIYILIAWINTYNKEWGNLQTDVGRNEAPHDSK